MRVPEHKTEGQVSVHVLSGHIQVRAAGRTFSQNSGIAGYLKAASADVALSAYADAAP